MFTLIAGLLLLSLGGEALIRGSLGAASIFKVSPLICGIVIVGFGTSAPELVVSVTAIMADKPEVALGNVVGSNIGNILFILGLCALIRPITINAKALSRDLLVVFGSTVACCVLITADFFNAMTGILLLSLLFGYIAWLYLSEKNSQLPSAKMHTSESKEVQVRPSSPYLVFLAIVAGLGMLIVGSNLFMQGAIDIAEKLEVSKATIGVTLVALGTSLPELTISVLAVIRKHNDVAIGNVLGSNIFNILGILGITALISPFPASLRILAFDQWVLAATVLLLLLVIFSLKRISRFIGFVSILAYGAYLWFGLVNFNY